MLNAMKATATALLLLASLDAVALAQEAPATGGALIGRLWDAVGLRAPPAPTPDFVRESRPGSADYLPLAPSPAPTQKRSAAQMQALGASLDAAIAANRAKAARVKTPDAAPHRRPQ